jgi:hypothetical protein
MNGAQDRDAALFFIIECSKWMIGCFNPKKRIMAKIFISYSSQNSAFVEKLSSDLALVGHTPWTDKVGINLGDWIVTDISEALSQSRCCVVVMSPEAIDSKWVEAEWKAVFWDSLTNQKIKIIPVLHKYCEMPFFLKGLMYADFTKSYAVGFAHLFMAFSGAESKMPNLLDIDYIHALEEDARHHEKNHIRLACAHTLWFFRPDRAIGVLEDALKDWSEVNRMHARMLVHDYY